MAGVSVTVAASTHPIVRIPVVATRRGRAANFFLRSLERQRKLSLCFAKKQKREIACAKLDMQKQEARIRGEDDLRESQDEIVVPVIRTDRMVRKQKERSAYLLVAVLSSLGVTSMIAASVYYRFLFQTEGAEIPVMEMVATFALTVGAVVGMEFWARWAHRALWHDSLWSMHESHHRPREGPFERVCHHQRSAGHGASCIRVPQQGALPGVVFRHGTRYHCVWHGLHVCARRARPQTVSGGSNCECALPPTSCGCPSGSGKAGRFEGAGEGGQQKD